MTMSTSTSEHLQLIPSCFRVTRNRHVLPALGAGTGTITSMCAMRPAKKFAGT
jgi:hypothetical protein